MADQIVTIQAEPTDVSVELAKTAIVVIDMQKDFLYEGGYGQSLGNDPTILHRTIKPVANLLEAARSAGMEIVHTREGHEPDLSDCPPTKLMRWPEGRRIGDDGPMGRILIRGEKGHQIIDEVAPIDGERIVDKPGKDAFYATDLDEYLKGKGIVSILFAGVTTDVCASTSISGANDRGFNAVVFSDCMAAYEDSRHFAALEIIKAQGGIFGWVADSSGFTSQL